ncbi:hypothetical protein CANCADRAFT_116023 [Tortispora caseinolytica NRRL Y-17796]|uniref:BZIP domain-containing protein n=1 Tax=Tortispora caseinolytica NRRL Y-17796 TaxID=767744 RepID=A0A1E4TH50_9ASCO|nr:hypothetical protein CANCADRAFT_116023 [Tortispora caseinolytica NRRL Y-17796]
MEPNPFEESFSRRSGESTGPSGPSMTINKITPSVISGIQDAIPAAGSQGVVNSTGSGSSTGTGTTPGPVMLMGSAPPTPSAWLNLRSGTLSPNYLLSDVNNSSQPSGGPLPNLFSNSQLSSPLTHSILRTDLTPQESGMRTGLTPGVPGTLTSLFPGVLPSPATVAMLGVDGPITPSGYFSIPPNFNSAKQPPQVHASVVDKPVDMRASESKQSKLSKLQGQIQASSNDHHSDQSYDRTHNHQPNGLQNGTNGNHNGTSISAQNQDQNQSQNQTGNKTQDQNQDQTQNQQSHSQQQAQSHSQPPPQPLNGIKHQELPHDQYAQHAQPASVSIARPDQFNAAQVANNNIYGKAGILPQNDGPNRYLSSGIDPVKVGSDSNVAAAAHAQGPKMEKPDASGIGVLRMPESVKTRSSPRTRKRKDSYTEGDEKPSDHGVFREVRPKDSGKGRKKRRDNGADVDESKRKVFLERNRVAAHKCRQRKKEWLAGLQKQLEYCTLENESLHNQVQYLRQQILSIHGVLRHHVDCSASEISPIPEMFLHLNDGLLNDMKAESNGGNGEYAASHRDAEGNRNGGMVPIKAYECI